MDPRPTNRQRGRRLLACLIGAVLIATACSSGPDASVSVSPVDAGDVLDNADPVDDETSDTTVASDPTGDEAGEPDDSASEPTVATDPTDDGTGEPDDSETAAAESAGSDESDPGQDGAGEQSHDGATPFASSGEEWYLGEYTLTDETFGSRVVVTLTPDSRIIESNAIPPWDASEFPEGNNTAISEQNNRYEIPLVPEFTGLQTSTIVVGVSINGIKFDAGTAQRAQCENGVAYRVEAVNDLIPFGLDEHGAHVQNDGTYHYHWVPLSELDGDDPEFVGWALDGFPMYYSPANQFPSSYQLRTEDRAGINCTYSEPDLAEITFDASPDGTFAEDWEYVAGSGSLDECNGMSINGTYVYFITDAYPMVPRCLNGSPSVAVGGGGGGGGGRGGGSGGAAPPGEAPEGEAGAAADATNPPPAEGEAPADREPPAEGEPPPEGGPPGRGPGGGGEGGRGGPPPEGQAPPDN